MSGGESPKLGKAGLLGRGPPTLRAGGLEAWSWSLPPRGSPICGWDGHSPLSLKPPLHEVLTLEPGVTLSQATQPSCLFPHLAGGEVPQTVSKGSSP